MRADHLRTIIQINFIFSLTLLLLVCASDHTIRVEDISEESSRSINCYNAKKDYLLVSTIDGKFSLLNSKNGDLKWSHKVGESLLSSSIGSFEVTRNGIRTRLIPSLDGSLYQFDGKSVEPLPLNADTLLSSSFKLSDDSVIVGGKTSETYGIDILSGRLKYQCSVKGCKKFEADSVQESEGTVVLNRNSKTVRSVEVESGIEKWNFSVGDHEVKYIPKISKNSDDNIDDVEVVSCPMDDDKSQNAGPHTHETLDYNFITADGIISACSPGNSAIVWKQNLESPLAQIWQIRNEEISELSLFDSKHVPSLASTSDKTEVALSAALYIGVYKDQLYVKPSSSMQNYLESKRSMSPNMPKLKWKPYMANAPSKTQAITGPLNLLRIGWSSTKSTDVSIWQHTDSYSNDLNNNLGNVYYDYNVVENGLYLFPDKPLKVIKKTTYKTTQIFSNQSVINEYAIFTIHYMDWRSLLAAFIVCIVLVRTIYLKCNTRKRTKNESMSSSISSKSETDTIIEMDKNSDDQIKDSEFFSRYLNDFEQLAVLGRGGFGVVFEARNYIDKAKYAVKRICTGSSKETERKVLREAQALARLDHPGIVRYYQSWVERPPLGWQEERDVLNRHLKDYISGSEYSQNPTATETLPTVNFSSKLTTSYTFPRDDEYEDSNLELDPSSQSDSDNCHVRKFSNNNYSDSISIVFEESSACNSKDKRSNEYRSEIRNRKTVTVETESKSTFSNSASTPPSPKNYLYIQMQLCEKNNLADWLFSRDMICKEKSFGIFYQIVSAVEYIHLNGFIHRDLKPSNIFFSLDEQIKVGDFGLAIEEEGLQDLQDTNTSRSSKHTRDVGTKLYMSPEQINGLHYNNKIDIYSLGLLFFELLNLFSTEMERRMTLEKAKSLSFDKTFTEENFEETDIITKMLNRNPESRPKAAEIIDLNIFSYLALTKRSKQRTKSTSSTSSTM
ncbi:DgyrCDS12002 [Dimorphilus gyrociliatus]|uniref:non-specific serine/threonine protein kinase n=1 Tax=Dimorphilus gyrociliatus TaxID=2664684 RepID=A0A7I8W5A7_9ANNE|nr:DgyrCDS12002 [Dimorphilus gyrociliatus]